MPARKYASVLICVPWKLVVLLPFFANTVANSTYRMIGKAIVNRIARAFRVMLRSWYPVSLITTGTSLTTRPPLQSRSCRRSRSGGQLEEDVLERRPLDIERLELNARALGPRQQPVQGALGVERLDRRLVAGQLDALADLALNSLGREVRRHPE